MREMLLEISSHFRACPSGQCVGDRGSHPGLPAAPSRARGADPGGLAVLPHARNLVQGRALLAGLAVYVRFLAALGQLNIGRLLPRIQQEGAST